MNESNREWEMVGESADGSETGSEYTVREAEARLDRRLEALEAQHSRTRGLALLTGTGFVVTLVSLFVVSGRTISEGGAYSVDSLAAREVVLRDTDGIERGRMSTDDQGRAMLSLSDRDGRQRIRMTVLADGSPGVTINDTDSRPRAVLGYLPDGTTNLVFTDPAGEIRTLVGVGPDGEPSMSMFDRESEDEGA
jgi:hypothetical protein